MTRLLLGAAIGFTVGIVGAAALGLHAQDLDGVSIGTVEAANEAQVPVHELLGAMSTTGLGPRAYLLMTGELGAPERLPGQAGGAGGSPSSATSVSWPWSALAQCESGGNWHIDAYHDGGLQFLPSTWLAYGGGAYARYAWQATPEQQIEIARRVQRAAGWSQWPVCSRRIGLR